MTAPDPTLFVKFYAVSEHTHFVMLNDGSVWCSWAGLPWTNQGMPPRCPFFQQPNEGV